MARLLRELFAQQGVAPNEVVDCDQLPSIIDLVRSGFGLGLVREDLAFEAAERGEVTFWPHGRIDCMLSLAYRLARENDPSVVALLSVARSHWQLAQ